MKQEPFKVAPIDLHDASLKLKLYFNKASAETGSHATQQRICHLAAENFLKFVESEEFTKENYEKLRSMLYEKKSYYLLYIVDILLKNSKIFMGLAKKDLESMFKAVWQKVQTQPKKQSKQIYMKAMVRTWGIIYPRKWGMEESLKKWLQEKYDTNLNLPDRLNALLEETYQKHKNQSDNKLSLLMSELSKQESTKKSGTSSIDLKHKIFQD